MHFVVLWVVFFKPYLCPKLQTRVAIEDALGAPGADINAVLSAMNVWRALLGQVAAAGDMFFSLACVSAVQVRVV